MVKRNSRFYWVARYLREAVAYYGCAGEDGPNGDEIGPFFTGMSLELNIQSFSIGLQGPTSTSRQRSIAVRFAGDEGMVIRLNNVIAPSSIEPFWDSTWIGRYPEEDERLFFGSLFNMQLETLTLVKSAKNYQHVMSAFSKFDALLSAAVIGDTVSHEELKIIDCCIKSVLGSVDVMLNGSSMLSFSILSTHSPSRKPASC